MNHFHAIDPLGFVHKRQSQSRVYLFTVVIKRGQAYADRQRSTIEASAIDAGKSWDRVTRESQGSFAQADQWRGENVLGIWKQSAAKFLSEHPDRVAYVEAAREHAQKQYEAFIAGGSFNTYENVGWCSRRDLADKLAGQYNGRGYEHVLVLPAIAGKAPEGGAFPGATKNAAGQTVMNDTSDPDRWAEWRRQRGLGSGA